MLEPILAKLVASGLASPATMRGCSEHEVAAIEARLGFALPRSYRAFLAVLGKEAGDFLRGTDFLWHDIPTLRAQAERALAPGGPELDERDYVFAVHQGYSFAFFRCDGTADPSVSVYEEGESAFRIAAESFTAWLAGAVDDEVHV